MRMSTGKIVDGQIVVEGVEFAEGATVIILEPDDEPVELTAEQEAELEEAIAEIERGEWITPEELFAQMRENRDQIEREGRLVRPQ